MRAVFADVEFVSGANLEISGEVAHHLSVARVKTGEEILVLNGNGEYATCKVENLTKKDVLLKTIKVSKENKKHNVSIAIGVPKKDAMEDIIKICVELGVNNIYPLTTQYSQYKLEENERLFRIIESALIQSNNLYWPKIYKQNSLEFFLENLKVPLVYFSSRKIDNNLSINSDEEIVILIGPEGGFSSTEEQLIRNYKLTNAIHLDTAIMRAPTAVATSVGYLLSKI
jgi:16S rRNA (uracil1498-N3)-methyltransferase